MVTSLSCLIMCKDNITIHGKIPNTENETIILYPHYHHWVIDTLKPGGAKSCTRIHAYIAEGL